MTNYPDKLIDYCIDNKVTIEEGLCKMIEHKLNVVDSGLKTLKQEVVDQMEITNTSQSQPATVTDDDINNVEEFLKFLDQYNNGSDEK